MRGGVASNEVVGRLLMGVARNLSTPMTRFGPLLARLRPIPGATGDMIRGDARSIRNDRTFTHRATKGNAELNLACSGLP